MSKELAMFLTNCVAYFLDRNTSGMCVSSKQCEELERSEQIQVCNSLGHFYGLFYNYIANQ